MMASTAVAGAFVLDRLAGEPPARVHPVASFGRSVAWFDRDWSAPRIAGLVVALWLPLVAGALGYLLTGAAGTVHPVAALAVATLALFSTISLRMLVRVGEETLAETARDPESAKGSIRALVGRDTADLSPAELRSATVESAAENLADGLVAPLVAFSLGAQVSLPLAVAGAVWVKGVNTLDSMLGYPDRRHGWASARLDDLVMWLPARVAAVLIAAAGLSVEALAVARRWAGATASPNAGWPMAAMAGVLGVGLVKPGAYALNPDAPLPDETTAEVGIDVVRKAGLLAFVLAGVFAWP